MGYFRFLLATLVAVSHFPDNAEPMNFGVSAVVAFYFLSGYLMTLSFGRFRERSARPVREFFLDRVLRLYPMLLFALACAAAWFWYDGTVTKIGWAVWLAQITVIPRNFQEMMTSEAWHGFPPTWSLGAEAQFYLLLPLILYLGRASRITLAGVLFLGQAVAIHVAGHVGDHWSGCASVSTAFCASDFSDVFGYRWLPCALTPFLIGTIAFEGQRDRIYAAAFKTFVALYGVLLLLEFAGLDTTYTMGHEILLAMVLLVPMGLLSALRIARDPLDEAAGKLAYPIFLFHGVGIAVAEAFLLPGFPRFAIAMTLTLSLSVVAAALQTRIDAYRYRVRAFGRVTGTGPTRVALGNIGN
jgi:peptidoglycan/LPS O-acetylase OafA/YrhL